MKPLHAGRLTTALAASTLMLLGVACGSTTATTPAQPVSAQKAPAVPHYPSAVTVRASEFAFSPTSIDLKAGQAVTLTIVNTGRVDHDMKSALPIGGLKYTAADNDLSEQADNSAKNVFDVDFGTGHTATVTFTPTTAGTFQFYCDESGHKAAGMVGTFVIH